MTAAPQKLAERDVTGQVRSFLECHGWRAIRHGRSVVSMPFGGVVQFGEPGMADLQFIRYVGTDRFPALTLTLWIEMKATGAKAKCRCKTKKARQRCTKCDQVTWRERERHRGGVVWVVDSIDWVMREYERVFGWLHHGDGARGQMELGLGA